jgi:sensor histidine kinase YesM
MYRMRYYMSEHPQATLLKELCARYKEISEEQKKQQQELQKQAHEKRERERKLDLDFE